MTKYGDSISTRGILGGHLGALGRVQPAPASTEPSADIFCLSYLSCSANVVHIATCDIRCKTTLICNGSVTGNDIRADIVVNSTLSCNANVIHVAQTTIDCQSTLICAAKVAHVSQVEIKCHPTLSCIGSRQFNCNSNINSSVFCQTIASLVLGATTNVTVFSSLSATGILNITNLTANSGLFGIANVRFVGTADIQSSVYVLANGSLQVPVIEEKPTPPSRIDWENTLGAAPGPVFGWAGGVGGLPPAIAVTFIHGKHIYSDVKKKKKDITVHISDVLRTTSEITVNLVRLSKTNKTRFKMKADHGKIYALEK